MFNHNLFLFTNSICQNTSRNPYNLIIIQQPKILAVPSQASLTQFKFQNLKVIVLSPKQTMMSHASIYEDADVVDV